MAARAETEHVDCPRRDEAVRVALERLQRRRLHRRRIRQLRRAVEQRPVQDLAGAARRREFDLELLAHDRVGRAESAARAEEPAESAARHLAVSRGRRPIREPHRLAIRKRAVRPQRGGPALAGDRAAETSLETRPFRLVHEGDAAVQQIRGRHRCLESCRTTDRAARQHIDEHAHCHRLPRFGRQLRGRTIDGPERLAGSRIRKRRIEIRPVAVDLRLHPCVWNDLRDDGAAIDRAALGRLRSERRADRRVITRRSGAHARHDVGWIGCGSCAGCGHRAELRGWPIEQMLEQPLRLRAREMSEGEAHCNPLALQQLGEQQRTVETVRGSGRVRSGAAAHDARIRLILNLVPDERE